MEAIHNLEVHDKRNAAVASLVSLILIYILLHFTYLYHNDPPIQKMEIIKPIPVEEFIEAPLLNDGGGGGGGGGGKSSEGPVDPTPKAQTQSLVSNLHGTKIDLNTKGKSSNDNSPNSNNATSNVKKSKDPFGDGGDGPGEGGGKGPGKGMGFGADTGDGKGPGKGEGSGGTGSGSTRIRTTDPDVNNIRADANHIIRLKVRINADGNVTSASVITSKTTTTDQSLISKVIARTVSQAKYKKKPGAAIEEAYITIEISAR